MANVVVVIFFSFILTLAGLQGIHAVEYSVTNNAATSPGGIRFNNEIGASYARQTLVLATNFIWRIFQQSSPSDRRNVPKVALFVDTTGEVAYASNNEIHVNAGYIQGYPGDVRREITGVLIHETTHVWQWDGNGQAPRALIEGIADYVRLKAGYVPSHWVKPGQGDRWDHRSDVTARFLDYCESLRPGFVSELNKKMRTGYSVSYFDQLLGKSVDQLFKDYKAKFNK